VTAAPPGALECSLRAARAGGRKLLVPYVTAGVTDEWLQLVAAFAAAGADAVEIGIPFSDPVMDGPTIQEASARSLGRGTNPEAVLAALPGLDAGVPLVAMTYYNLVFRAGHARFASRLAAGGVAGAVVPDLPLEESAGWEEEASASNVETVLLAAPVTPDDRLARICARSRGFVYGVGVMGVTGERSVVAASATTLAKRLKAVTDKPVIIGFGVSTPDHAREICAEADGVIVASALMRRVLDGASVEDVAALVQALRSGLDAG
jgi:tryptophan synthase alpha chain